MVVKVLCLLPGFCFVCCLSFNCFKNFVCPGKSAQTTSRALVNGSWSLLLIFTDLEMPSCSAY